jgi:hypothetical protein
MIHEVHSFGARPKGVYGGISKSCHIYMDNKDANKILTIRKHVIIYGFLLFGPEFIYE